jgi:hypothetical protein
VGLTLHAGDPMAQVHKSVLAVVFHAGFGGLGFLLFVGAWFDPLFDYSIFNIL